MRYCGQVYLVGHLIHDSTELFGQCAQAFEFRGHGWSLLAFARLYAEQSKDDRSQTVYRLCSYTEPGTGATHSPSTSSDSVLAGLKWMQSPQLFIVVPAHQTNIFPKGSFVDGKMLFF